jgi:hypothetical protein
MTLVMNLEEKIKLFGHFMFCNVKCGDMTIILQSIDGDSGCINGLANHVQLPIEDCKLVLKDLKHITRKEALHCAELANIPASLCKNWEVKITIYGHAEFSFPDVDNYRNRIIFKEDHLNWKQCDYLRGRGFVIGVPEDCYMIEEKEEKK